MAEETPHIARASLSRLALPALLAGLGVGWLSGLSVSETVASTIGALMALIGGIGAGLFSVARAPQKADVDLWPVALLAFGIALGASAGVYARTHQWLGASDPDVARTRAGGGVLYGDAATLCASLKRARDGGEDELRRTLAIRFPASGPLFTGEAADAALLRAFVEDLCDTR